MLGKFFSKKKNNKEEEEKKQPAPAAPEGRKKIVIKRRSAPIRQPKIEQPIIDEMEDEDDPVLEETLESVAEVETQEEEPVQEIDIADETLSQEKNALQGQLDSLLLKHEELNDSHKSGLALIRKLTEEKEEILSKVESLEQENTRLIQSGGTTESNDAFANLLAEVEQLKAEKQAILTAKASLEAENKTAGQRIDDLKNQKKEQESLPADQEESQLQLAQLRNDQAKLEDKIAQLELDRQNWEKEKEELDAIQYEHKGALVSLKKELANLMADFEQEVKEHKVSKQEMGQEINQIQQKNLDLVTANTALKSDMETAKVAKAAVVKENNRTVHQVETLQNEKVDLIQSLEKSEAERKAALEDLKKASAQAKADQEVLRIKIKTIEKEHTFTLKKYEFQEEEKAKLHTNIQLLEEDVAELKKTIKDNNKQTGVYKVENEQFIVTNKALYRENEELEKDIAKLEKERDKLKNKLEGMEETFNENNSKLAFSKHELHQLEENRISAENFSQKLVLELEQVQDQYKALRIELEEAKKQNEDQQLLFNQAMKERENKHKLELHKAKSGKEEDGRLKQRSMTEKIKELEQKVALLKKQNQSMTKQIAEQTVILQKTVAQNKAPKPVAAPVAEPVLFNLVVNVMPDDDEYDVELPDFALGSQIVSEFAEAGILSQGTRYSLKIKRSNSPILDEKSLGESGVQEGDTIVIKPF